MSERIADWPELLAAFVESRLATPFAWGSNDCVTFVADAAQAISGDDPLGALRGQWTTDAEAEAVLSTMGGLQAAVTATLGAPLEAPSFAQRGDALLVRMPGTGAEIMALCLGSRWACPGDEGLTRGPMSYAVAAWPIARGAA